MLLRDAIPFFDLTANQRAEFFLRSADDFHFRFAQSRDDAWIFRRIVKRLIQFREDRRRDVSLARKCRTTALREIP